ncbi:MAG: MoxR family ATPase [Lachnospiraceae bacterium]|nr:MoxR family ATPase [Lachnospiraceae bacterium]
MALIEELKNAICDIFVGKESVAENLLICLLSGGHVLLEDVPGVGKTTLAKTMAGALGLDFGRIQFTPDTLPSDIIGTSVYDMHSGKFSFREGAVMHQVLLADEINRTSPKTQASLLEAMAEGQVTADGNTYPLPKPFIVIATQNPVDFLGTYPLPEAQMDRFLMRLSLGYPEESEELRLAMNFLSGKNAGMVEPVCGAEEILRMQQETEKVHLSEGMLRYVREMVNLTRSEESLVLGASPRAMLHLLRAAQAKAYLEGRDYGKPDDAKAVAGNVLAHRLSLTPEARIRGEDLEKLLTSLILRAKVPMD